MDIPAAAALYSGEAAMVPAVALGVVLGIVLVTVAGLVAHLVLRRPQDPRPGAGASADPAGAGVEDDLPGFLEFPPGAAGARPTARDGWPALGAVPAPPVPAAPGMPARGRDARVVLGAMAAAAVVLLGIAAAVATTSRSGEPAPGAEPRSRPSAGTPAATPSPDGRPAPAPVPTAPVPGDPGAGALAEASVPPGEDGVEVRLEFAGVVLERHAVGVSATYPTVAMTSDGEESLAHVQLPTFHCLTGEAPGDPDAAGCVRSVTEYAELSSPALEVTDRDGGLRLSGRFPTYVRPHGGPPVWTGRVYELVVTVERGDGPAPAGWRSVVGSLRLGSDSSRSTGGPEVNVLRRGA